MPAEVAIYQALVACKAARVLEPLLEVPEGDLAFIEPQGDKAEILLLRLVRGQRFLARTSISIWSTPQTIEERCVELADAFKDMIARSS